MDAIASAVTVTDVVVGMGAIGATIALALVARMGIRKLLSLIK